MKKVLLIAVAIAAVGIGGYYADVARRTQLGEQALAATKLDFLSFDQALAQSKLTHKPVLADFSAIWCPTCRALHQTVFTDPAVQAAIRDGYVLARVDYEAPEAQEFMRRYAVSSFPSLLVIDGEGHALRRLPISFDPAAFAATLRAG